MLSFFPTCHSVDELEKLIDSDFYEQSIRRYFLTLLRDRVIIDDAADYIELQAIIEDQDLFLNLSSYQLNYKNALEHRLSLQLANKVRFIRSKITDEIVKETFKDYQNANRLFLDIERWGFPKMVMDHGGARIYANFNSIEMDDMNIILKGEQITLRVSYLSDCLVESKLAHLISNYRQCFTIYSDFTCSNTQLYWV